MAGTGVRINLLGPLEIVVDGVAIRGERPQVLQLALRLAVAAGQPVATDVLVEAMWRPEDCPRDPAAALRVIVSRLRGALAPHGAALHAQRGAYQLEASTDLAEFEQLVGSEGPDAPVDSLERAIGLWRGTPLGHLPGAPWIDDVRWRAENRYLTAAIRLAELLVAEQRGAEAIALLAPLAVDNGADERLAIAMSAALTMEGRRSEALDLLASTRTELRTGLGLDPGMAFVEHERAILTGAIDLARPSPATGPTSAVFIGRQRELDTLVTPRAGVTLLSGQAGIGKSALLDQVVARLDSTGRDSIKVAAPPAPVRAMQTLADLIGGIIDQGGDAASLSPGLSNLVAMRTAGAPTAPALFTRESLIAEAVAFIGAHARRHDVVLIIDDAHWLDLGTAEVLEGLAAPPGCRMILSVRSEGPRTSVPLLDSGAVTDLLQLDRFELDDVRLLVDQTLDGPSTDATLERLHARSGGNPLFLALLIDLANEGVPNDEHLPASALVAVQRRLEALSGRCRQNLRHAAILGQDFSLTMLAPVSPGALDDLRDAEEAGLVVLDVVAAQGRFTHQLVHEGIYQLVPEGERLSWHDHFGRQLEDAGEPATAYVTHALAAAEIDPVRAAVVGVDAARLHARAYAWDQCLALAEAALASGPDAMPARPRAELQLLVGMSLRRMGRDSAPELLEAARLAEADGDLHLRAEATCELCGHGGTTLAGNVHDEGHRHLTAVLAEPLSDHDRARLLASAGPLYATSERSPEGRAMYLQAMALAAELDDPKLELEVLMNSDLGLSSPEDLETRRANAERLKVLAPNDPDVAWEAAYLLHGIACVEQDLGAAAEHLAEIRRLTGRVRARPRELGRTLAEVAHHVGLGDLEEAEAWAERVPEAGAAFSDSWITLTYGASLMSVRHAQGRLPEVMPLVEAAIGSSPSTYSSFRAIAAGVAAAAGDRESAQRELDRLRLDGFACISLADLPSTMLLSMLADAAVFTGDSAAASTLFDRLQPFGDRLAWSGVSTHGPIADRLSALQPLLGRPVRPSGSSTPGH
ncbi:MAG: AAA family ATPase [Acidimicrobiales bacterium]|nr:AAA family ATPase [Acidimicrobiales bacterium]